MSYYSNINTDLLDAVPTSARKVLEVGCGEGWFGKRVKELSPQCEYHGVELFPDAAQVAANNLDLVIQGNIEDAKLLSSLPNGYDLLVFGDLLEHLINPWETLKILAAKAAPQSTCVACIPNVSHWSIVANLLQGKWEYQDAGLLDRTHLRFFTVETMFKMFQDAGWHDKLEARPRILWPERTQDNIQALLPAAKSLGIDEKTMITNCRAFQWVIKAERF